MATNRPVAEVAHPSLLAGASVGLGALDKTYIYFVTQIGEVFSCIFASPVEAPRQRLAYCAVGTPQSLLAPADTGGNALPDIRRAIVANG